MEVPGVGVDEHGEVAVQQQALPLEVVLYITSKPDTDMLDQHPLLCMVTCLSKPTDRIPYFPNGDVR